MRKFLQFSRRPYLATPSNVRFYAEPTPNNSKPTVVIIGSGWAGAHVAKGIRPELCNLVVLSQRNHMLFTPLLPQTCTGTLEFRAVCEPVQRIQPALAQLPNSFYRTMAYDVDFDKKVVNCIAVGVLGAGENVPVKGFEYKYDYLVLAHGARANTFNIPGVEENAFFLREISEARGIRRRIVQNLMTAKLPTTSQEEVERLLHFVVVGGGPTGVEFAADIADFLKEDIPQIDPALLGFCQVTLVEASEVLGTFDEKLRNYAAKRLVKIGVKLRKAVVAEVTENAVILTDGEVLRTGLVVWSTGVGSSSFSRTLKCDKNRGGRIAIDGELRVLNEGKVVDSVYALGDCAADTKTPLPTLAAVASRQGKFLAKKLNNVLANKSDNSIFVFRSLGSMASLGRGTALVELKQPATFDLTGLRAYFLWKSAYLTMMLSIRTRLYVLVNWAGSRIFGRDITYIAEISEWKLWKALATEGATREQSRRRIEEEAAKYTVGVVSVTTEHPHPASAATVPAPADAPSTIETVAAASTANSPKKE